MELLVVPVILLGVTLLVAPFVAGRTLSHRHDDVAYTPHTVSRSYVPPSMVGYVAPEDPEELEFFQADPLTSHSLPESLAHASIADTVLFTRIAAGALPPARIFPVDATWRPWGYELPPGEASYAFQPELELTSH